MPKPTATPQSARKRKKVLLLSAFLIAAFFALNWLNYRYSIQTDWTFGQRNTLSEGSQNLLGRLDQPLYFEAYYDTNAALREQVRRLVAKYQRFKSDIDLTFLDAKMSNEQSRELGFSHLGQVKIKYGEKEEILGKLSEKSISNAIQKLARVKTPWVVILQGHGERDPFDRGTHGYYKLAKAMQDTGVRVQTLNLLGSPFIPDNTGVLIIAGANQDFLPGETKIVLDYLEKGGHFLWLQDPSSPSPNKLMRFIDSKKIDGVVIDANPQLHNVLGIKHPAVIPIVRYQRHAITEEISSHTLFPFASAFEQGDSLEWQSRPLLLSLDRTWSETGSVTDAELVYDQEQGDIRGPHTLGFALTRKIQKPNEEQHEQRIVIIGDSDFLANGYLGSGANLQLGTNIIHWLNQDENLLSILPHQAPDQRIELSKNAVIAIAASFLLLLPGILLALGFVIRWRRNRS